MFDGTSDKRLGTSGGHALTRRRALRTAALGLGAVSATSIFPRNVVGDVRPRGDDLAIDDSTALLFSGAAPLVPGPGLRDARAVWCHIPTRPDGGVLIFLHGHNGYVTVDAKGHSRVPDWAAGDAAASAGASAKQAAPLIYQLDRLAARKTGKSPIVIVPEVSTLANGSFWAKEPAGQYADPARLGLLLTDCRKRLACLQRPGRSPYLAEDSLKRGGSTNPARVYLCGHSGAGLPIEEAARSTLILPGVGAPTDLWLFDSTYWSRVDGFVQFCERWHRAGRLAGGRADAARFVCIYRPGTQTEEVADALRAQIARVIGVEAQTLVRDHSPENVDKVIRPALRSSGVVFVRTDVSHDEIPTVFVPVLLESAAT